MTVATRKGQIAVVEVLGLPGSGKTTVVEAVSQNRGIEAMSRYRSPANAVPYAVAALELLPVLVPSLWQGRSWRERNKLIRLASSRSVVRRLHSIRRVTTSLCLQVKRTSLRCGQTSRCSQPCRTKAWS